MFAVTEMGREPRQASFHFDLKSAPLDGVRKPPDQTNAKSRLIAAYLSKFQLVTKGGLYIDGFAAPQSRDHEEAWTARRVLEIVPPRLRTFWLCDMEPRGLLQLRRLKQQHHGKPPSRRVFVIEGDFNQSVKGILKSDRLTRKAAIFALLDQRNTECHWATVKALASRAGRTKIELLYFLGTSWLHRSLATSERPERIAEIDRWWGGPSWRSLTEMKQLQIVRAMADRFAQELGYQFVKPYPIMLDDDGTKAAFHLIHASDHPDAPKLMDRAYLDIVGDVPGVDLGRQRSMDI
jgi:three-Cys-motif partner protein